MQIYKFISRRVHVSISRPMVIKIKHLKYLSLLFFESILIYFTNLFAINETEIKISNAWKMKIAPNIINWFEIFIVSENKKFGK